jgi:hypothetical protein
MPYSCIARRPREAPLKLQWPILPAPPLLLIKVMNQVDPSGRQWLVYDVAVMGVERLAEMLQNRFLNLWHRKHPPRWHALVCSSDISD